MNKTQNEADNPIANVFATDDGISVLYSMMKSVGYGTSTLLQTHDNSVDPVGTAYNEGRKSIVCGLVAEVCASGRSDIIASIMARLFEKTSPEKATKEKGGK